MSAHTALCILFAALLLLAFVASAEEFKEPPLPENLPDLGSRIQRTMTLLATSTPQKRNHVRILFYGQSVTAGPWSKAVADDLRKAYPNADLEVENRAIGGYSAPALINTADYDLYPFYPDLMVFHVYGGVEDGTLAQIIARTRQRTTSEILIRTPHFRWSKDLPRDGSADDPQAQKLYQEDEKQSKLIRELSQKYGCELAEVRERLRKHLKDNNLLPKDTLGDSVHPNKLGNFLIEKLILPYLRYDPKFPKDPWKDLVKDISVKAESVKRGPDGGNVFPDRQAGMAGFKASRACRPIGKNTLELPFDGNRVNLIAAHTNQQKLGTAKVFIDGKPPSQFPELYYHARPNAAPQVWWPAINRIGWQKPLIIEKWTARILECDPDKNRLLYEVIGSETGPDGKGDQTKKFVSNSGRVVIDPGMWMICHTLRYRKITLPKDYEVTWEVKPLFVDVYTAPKTNDAAKEYATTLAQGLTNATHTLRIVPNGDGPVPLEAIRVYRPPLRTE
jgi:hypothetical protein